jgi:hypothetical protein
MFDSLTSDEKKECLDLGLKIIKQLHDDKISIPIGIFTICHVLTTFLATHDCPERVFNTLLDELKMQYKKKKYDPA